MKMLVTGGAGFIGSHIVEQYVQAGHEVVVVDNLSTGKRENLHPNTRFYELDIQQQQELAKIFAKEKPEIVNHQAAQISASRSLKDPLNDAQTNVLGSLSLLECCRQYSVKKIIYASTAAVYGTPETLLCTEAHPIQPVWPYGVSKYYMEQSLWLYHHHYGIPYAIFRYGNVYGPRQDPYGEAGVVSIFIEKMLEGKQPRINGDGKQTRDFVFVRDVAHASLCALQPAIPSGVFNIATGTETSVNTLFNEIKQLLKSPLQPNHGQPIVTEVRTIALDNAKAKKTLSWKPTTLLTEGLRQTIAWYKER
ncbi:NAD-dependent epimerase/dehydratase family protein [Candidatus Woesearchaeota archaeon]|nr:NAD-dependent epimerase/dehydratase family protein [Candidatus Woesearchaeota archaeon]